MFKRLLLLKSVPNAPDFGLLALRVIPFLVLFIKHGTEKLFGFGTMLPHFADPIHIGVFPSLLFATFTDGICSLLLIVGLATRWSAFLSFVTLITAWVFQHHFLLFGKNSDHGELIVLYMAALIALFFIGPGRFSIDALIEKSGEKETASHARAGMARA